MQKLFSERIVDPKLFRNLIRRRLPHILVAFLASFFAVVVPFAHTAEFIANHYSSQEMLAYLPTYAQEAVRTSMGLQLFCMFVLGIYFGVIALRYIMRRRTANFWHALPQKRETLYMTSVTNAILCMFIGTAVNTLIAVAELFMLPVPAGDVLPMFLILHGKNLIYFLVSFAITLFVGSFSGSSLVQVLMTLVAFFWPFLTYVGVVILPTASAAYYNETYFLQEKILVWLSPVVYSVWRFGTEVSFLPLLTALLTICVLILGGLEIYKKRPMENAEKTIVFPKLGSVLKYLLLFTTTLYAGTFFSLFGGTFWTIFGFVCGGLLGFMLYNTILAKSPKAMFKGLRGLALFAVLFAAYYLFLGADVLRLDEKIPKSPSYAEITVEGLAYTDNRFDDPEMLSTLSAMLEEQVKMDHDSSHLTARANSFNLEVTYFVLGIPVPRSYEIRTESENVDTFLRLYADDARMQELYEKTADHLLDTQVWAHLLINTDGGVMEYTGYINAKAFMDVYRTEIGKLNYDRLSQTPVAAVRFISFRNSENNGQIYVDDAGFNEFPVYVDMVKTLAFLQTSSEQAVRAMLYEPFAARATRIKTNGYRDEATLSEAETQESLAASVCEDYLGFDTYVFVPLASEYSLWVERHCVECTNPEKENRYTDMVNHYFLREKVPDFVPGLFE